jgi:dGTPase
VVAAALAHDIGNPPLGHAGEEAIRYWFENSPAGQEISAEMSEAEQADFRKYDGNAQGFRVLSRLEMPDRPGGMQLTCATLGAFAKYPGAAQSGLKKCGFFQQDKAYFSEVAESCGLLKNDDSSWKRHPLSFLLEAADDIAYLTVDFEDALRQGLIEYSELETFFLSIIDDENSARYVRRLSSPLRKAEYLRAQVIGVLVRSAADEFIRHHDELMAGSWNIPLTETIAQKDILGRIRARSASWIYNHPSVAEIIGAGFELVMGMLDIFVPCVSEIDRERCGRGKASSRSIRIAAMLPEMVHREYAGDAYSRLLGVLDYISGMTDRNAVSLYQKLKGISL